MKGSEQMSLLNQGIRKDSSICDRNDQLLQLKMFDLRPEVGLFVSAHLKHQRGGATGFPSTCWPTAFWCFSFSLTINEIHWKLVIRAQKQAHKCYRKHRPERSRDVKGMKASFCQSDGNKSRNSLKIITMTPRGAIMRSFSIIFTLRRYKV